MVKFFEQILDFLFPPRCVACGKFGTYLCESCFGKIEFAQRQFCPICGKPSIGGFAHPGCKRPFSLDGALTVANYQSIMHNLISLFKYKPFLTDLQTVFQHILNLTLTKNYFTEKFIVAAVPLHWTRKNWRGYNQAEILGKIVAEFFNFEFNQEILRRIRFTKPQTQLAREERWENVSGAFALYGKTNEKIKGKSILLVDDVWTTGATLKECGKVLKRNGAAKVWAFTLCKKFSS